MKYKVGDKIVGPTDGEVGDGVCGGFDDGKIGQYCYSVVTDVGEDSYSFKHFDATGQGVGMCYICCGWEEDDLKPYISPEELREGDWCEVIEEFKQDGQVFLSGERFKVQGSTGRVVTLVTPGKVGTGGSWNIFEEHISKLRKVSGPEEKREQKIAYESERREAELREQCIRGLWTPSSCISLVTSDDPAMIAAARRLFEPSTSPTPTLMDHLGSAVKFIRDKALSKSEKTLRKAGFKDSVGEWTEVSQNVLIEMLLEERSEDLVKLADEMIKSEEKKCCK